jgi:hypothetical protein
MPAFDHGAVAIVVCPDAGADAPLAAAPAHHHHGKGQHQHPACPYASAASLGALGANFAALIGVLVFAAALLLGRTFLFVERNSRRERPPTRAPPLPA